MAAPPRTATAGTLFLTAITANRRRLFQVDADGRLLLDPSVLPRYTFPLNLPLESARKDLLPPAADTKTWLLPNGESLDEQIERSLMQVERGEGMNEEQLRAFLAERRASRKA